MNDYTFISDYKHKNEPRNSFNDLAQLIFGIDFEKWYQLGLWNDNYICFSYIYNNTVVANASINTINTTINGENMKAIQIGTVMTHPDHRRKGLASKLMDHIIKTYEQQCDFFYLFPDDDAQPLYLKFGFEETKDRLFCFSLEKERSNTADLKQLTVHEPEHKKIIVDIVENRTPLSDIFDTSHAAHIFYWYCINVFGSNLYYNKSENCLIAYKQHEQTLHIYDVISDHDIDLDQLLCSMNYTDINEIIFYFTPDHLIDIRKCSQKENEITYVRPLFSKFPKNFAHPYSAHA